MTNPFPSKVVQVESMKCKCCGKTVKFVVEVVIDSDRRPNSDVKASYYACEYNFLSSTIFHVHHDDGDSMLLQLEYHSVLEYYLTSFFDNVRPSCLSNLYDIYTVLL